MPFEQIEITPLIATGTSYINNDVIFGMTEFQMPAKDCVIRGGFVIDDSGTLDLFGQDGEDDANKINQVTLHFFQKNTHAPGAPQDQLGLTAAQMEENGYLTGVHVFKGDNDLNFVTQEAAGNTGPNAIINKDLVGFDLPRIYKIVQLSDIFVDTTSESTNARQGNHRMCGLTSTSIGNKMFVVGLIDRVSTSSDANEDKVNFTALGQIRILLSLEY